MIVSAAAINARIAGRDNPPLPLPLRRPRPRPVQLGVIPDHPFTPIPGARSQCVECWGWYDDPRHT